MRGASTVRLRIASSSALVCALVTLSSGDARGHLAPPIVRADRTLTVTLFERPTLAYSVRISPVELARVRADNDVDRDGALSPAEAEALLAAWTNHLRTSVRYAHRHLPLGSTAGAPLSSAILLGREATGLEGPTSIPSPATAPSARVAWSFDLRFARDGETLTLLDDVRFLPFDHSDVIVRDTAERPLVGLAMGEGAPSPTPHLAWVDGGTHAPRTVVVTWRAPRDLTTLVVLGLASAAAGLFVVLSARSHRRRG